MRLSIAISAMRRVAVVVCAPVWGDDHVVECEQFVIRGRRLLLEGIQADTAHGASPDGGESRGLIDQAAT